MASVVTAPDVLQATAGVRQQTGWVFGLGTGRCGTLSLAHLLGGQAVPRKFMSHERAPILPWVVDHAAIVRKVHQLSLVPDCTLRGDVALYYLPYVRWLLDYLPQSRFVCLQRDEEATVNSFRRWMRNIDLWTCNPNEQHSWCQCFPKYATRDRTQALHYYWQDYYHQARVIQEEYPERFRIFPTETLNNRAGVKDLLTFTGIPANQQTIVTGIHNHRS